LIATFVYEAANQATPMTMVQRPIETTADYATIRRRDLSGPPADLRVSLALCAGVRETLMTFAHLWALAVTAFVGGERIGVGSRDGRSWTLQSRADAALVLMSPDLLDSRSS
jgi:hypothetical protein